MREKNTTQKPRIRQHTDFGEHYSLNSSRKKGESTIGQRIKEIIKKIPEGKVATYGQIAALAGNPRAARQVAWILHSSSRKDKLPWHRVSIVRAESPCNETVVMKCKKSCCNRKV